MPYPSNWHIFLQQIKEQPTALDSELAIFGARFRLATEFSGLELGNIGSETAAYYSAIAKIGLAYACLERLETILLDKSHSAINAPDLAARLRSERYEGLFDLAIEHSTNEKLKEKLKILRYESDENNVRPFVESIRHSLFHGRFTPGTSGQRVNKGLIELLDDLAHVTLRHANQSFSFAIKLRAKR